MNVFNLERVFKQKKERGWKTIYVAIDLHGTVIKPYHHCIEFYTGSVEVLKWFNSREDFRVILWTSSYEEEMQKFYKECEKHGIKFDMINSNLLERDSDRAFFGDKFYFNILLDDKAGFEPETDWELIKAELQRLGEWDKNKRI